MAEKNSGSSSEKKEAIVIQKTLEQDHRENKLDPDGFVFEELAVPRLILVGDKDSEAIYDTARPRDHHVSR